MGLDVEICKASVAFAAASTAVFETFWKMPGCPFRAFKLHSIGNVLLEGSVKLLPPGTGIKTARGHGTHYDLQALLALICGDMMLSWRYSMLQRRNNFGGYH